MLNLRLATNESYVDKNKEPQERTEWHTVVIWGNRAEGLARVLTKGSSVLIEGSLRTSSYEKDGLKRYRTEVHAREIRLRREAVRGAPRRGARRAGRGRGARSGARPRRRLRPGEEADRSARRAALLSEPARGGRSPGLRALPLRRR